MSTPHDPQKSEHASTYVVQGKQSKDELARLTLQDHIANTKMGGPLSEQDDPQRFHHILDVACGTGGWIIEVARTYPETTLVGIDISQRMIDHARQQAALHQVADRIEFHVLDGLHMSELPAASFDLVNMRFAVGFLRIWDWPNMISEMLRVTRINGTIRITESEVAPSNTSPALTQLGSMLQNSLFRAGHLFEDASTGLSAHLGPLLTQYGCKQVQTKVYQTKYKMGTPDGKLYCENLMRVFQVSRPFIQKWGNPANNYDELYQQLSREMQQADFTAAGDVTTAWGTKPNWQ